MNPSPISLLRKRSNRLHSLSKLASVTALLLTSLILATAVSASTGCAPNDPQVWGWPKNTTVYYSIGGFPPDVQAQIEHAFTLCNVYEFLRQSPAGIDKFLSVPAKPLIATSGGWPGNDVFQTKILLYQTPYYATLTFKFEGNRVLLDTQYNVSFGPRNLLQLIGQTAR